MSLVDPNIVERMTARFTALPTVWRVAIWCAIGLCILGAILYGYDRTTGYIADRRIRAEKAKVNAVLGNVANAQSNIDKLTGKRDEQIEDAKNATNTFLDAVNASDEARAEADKALANVEKARNAKERDVEVEALRKKLEELYP